MKPIYRIRFFRGRFGEGWNAYCQPGYSPLVFPGIAGSKSLADCLARCRAYIETARKMEARS